MTVFRSAYSLKLQCSANAVIPSQKRWRRASGRSWGNKNEILQARQLLPNSELYFINGISDVRNAPGGELPENQDDFARAQQGAERIMHLLAAPEATTVEVMTVKARPARNARDTGPETEDSKVRVATPIQPAPRKISARKNLEQLLRYHLALGHRNCRDLAEQFGLHLPDSMASCWACLAAKPKSISPDRQSSRVATRAYQYIAADAKGPMITPTPEGYLYFFVLVCLYSGVHWTVLAKSQAAWAEIWPDFVRRAQASTGSKFCVAQLITDGYKVHSQHTMAAFNAQNGVEPIA